MSRNLGVRDCYNCGHPVEFTSPAHPITRDEAGRYYDEYEGMIVAMAECPICLAKYLAWIDQRNCVNPVHKDFALHMDIIDNRPFDLSYLSTFNDEPGEEDLPVYDVQKIETWHRVAKIR